MKIELNLHMRNLIYPLRKISLFIIALLLGWSVQAQEKGFDLTVRFKQPIKESSLIIGRYYAKTSITLKFGDLQKQADGSFHLKIDTAFTGGIYWILYDDNKKMVDFVLDNGYQMEVLIDTTDLFTGSQYSGPEKKGAQDNNLLQQYRVDDREFRTEAEHTKEQLAQAKNKSDSTKILDKLEEKREDLYKKNKQRVEQNPNGMFALVIKALSKPTPPEGPHYKEDGKTIDSFYNYRYIKAHFWDDFEVWDNRLAFMPIYDEKLKDYFDNYVYPIPDSMEYEADILLSLSRPASDMFRYTLHWLGNYSRTKKVMGAEEVFVYLVEKYYAKGDAYWLDSASLSTNYLIPAEDMSYTKLGKVGQDLELFDAYTYEPRNLHSVQAEYTILVFWDPECGTCKKEIPAIDSLYKALNWKDKNIAIYSVPQDKSLENIHKKIEDLGVKHSPWTHNVNFNGVRLSKLYSFNSNPSIFVLDKDKKIIGKKINHTALEKVINHDIEEKKKGK